MGYENDTPTEKSTIIYTKKHPKYHQEMAVKDCYISELYFKKKTNKQKNNGRGGFEPYTTDISILYP